MGRRKSVDRWKIEARREDEERGEKGHGLIESTPVQNQWTD